MVTAEAILTGFGPSETVSEVDVTFNGAAGSFSSLDLVLPPGGTGSTIGTSGLTVQVLPSESASQAYQILGEVVAQFTFIVPGNIQAVEADVKALSNDFHTSTGTQAGTVTLSFATVPQPPSWSLLAIGLTGFVAYRWFFNNSERTVVT
jgi:hypothetical protein